MPQQASLLKGIQTSRRREFRPLWKPYRGVWKIRLAHRSLKWKPVDVLSGTHTDTWTLKRQTHTALLHCSFTFWAWCRTGCLQFRAVWIEIPGTAVVDLEAREKYLWKYLVFITYICHKGLNLMWDQLSSDPFSLVGFQTFRHFGPMKTSGLLRFKGALFPIFTVLPFLSVSFTTCLHYVSLAVSHRPPFVAHEIHIYQCYLYYPIRRTPVCNLFITLSLSHAFHSDLSPSLSAQWEIRDGHGLIISLDSKLLAQG